MSDRNYKWLGNPENFIVKMYSRQKHKSKERGHPLPRYTLQELKDYLMSNSMYIDMFKKYIKSGRDKYLAPSIDRIDEGRGYSFDNIRIGTWEDNMCQPRQSLCCKVQHIDEDGNKTTYKSISDAAKSLNTSKQRIACIVSGKTKKSQLGYFVRL